MKLRICHLVPGKCFISISITSAATPKVHRILSVARYFVFGNQNKWFVYWKAGLDRKQEVKVDIFFSWNEPAYFWRAKLKQQIVFYLYFCVPWLNQYERERDKNRYNKRLTNGKSISSINQCRKVCGKYHYCYCRWHFLSDTEQL
jgi:hypothetical protein